MSKTSKTFKLAILGALIAIIIIMAFTPVGYLHVGVIEITFIMIPVVIGAVLQGPIGGLICGTVFGITSFIQCFGLSAFGGTLLSINPVFTAILCIVTRMLAGFLTGLIFKAINKHDSKDFVSVMVSCIVGPLLNTILFTGTLLLLFGNSDFVLNMRAGKSILAFVGAFVGINGLIEMAVTFILGTSISKALLVAEKKIH